MPGPVEVVRARAVDDRVWSYQCQRCRGEHFTEARAGLTWAACANVQLLVMPPEPVVGAA